MNEYIWLNATSTVVCSIIIQIAHIVIAQLEPEQNMIFDTKTATQIIQTTSQRNIKLAFL